MPGKKGSKHAKLQELINDGVPLVAKVCNECGIAKPLDAFYKAKRGIGQRRPKCITCMSPTGRKLTQLVETIHNGQIVLSKSCKKCEELLPLDKYYKGKGAGNRITKCIECVSVEERMKRTQKREKKKLEKFTQGNTLAKASVLKQDFIWLFKDRPYQVALSGEHHKHYLVQTFEGYEAIIPSCCELEVITDRISKKMHTSYILIEQISIGDRIGLICPNIDSGWTGDGTFEQGWLLGEILGEWGLTGKSNYAYVCFWGNEQKYLAEVALDRVRTSIGARKDLKGNIVVSRNQTLVKASGLNELIAHFGLNIDKKITPEIELASFPFYCGFLRGVFDSDGSVQGGQTKGISIRLSQSDFIFLQGIQRMLLRVGIVSTIYRKRKGASYRKLPDGKGGKKLYWCKDNHELVISNESILRYAKYIGFEDREKMERLTLLISKYLRKPNKSKYYATVEKIDSVLCKGVMSVKNVYNINSIKVKR